MYTVFMLYNYHTHTYRCEHATGKERNYIENAIAGGIKKMGFSEHIPLVHNDGFQSFYRLKLNDVKNYFDVIKSLSEEYKKQIEIFVGFETEYYPSYFDKTIDFAIKAGAEYFILGQHQINTDRLDGYDGLTAIVSYDETDDANKLRLYVNTVIDAINTSYVSYVAHPDIYHFIGDEKTYLSEYARLFNECKKLNVPVEINCLGIRDNRYYPNCKMWKLAGEIGVPVVIGMDAHDEAAAYDEKSLIVANKMIKDFNLNFISDYTPKLITDIKK